MTAMLFGSALWGIRTGIGTMIMVAGLFLAGDASRLDAQRSGNGSAVTISGQVLNESTGEAIPGALIEVYPLGRRAVTDERGEFRLRVRGKDHLLAVSQIGYGTVHQTVSLEPGGTDRFVFHLSPEPLMLEELRVVADRFESRRNSVPLSSRVLDRDRLLRAGGQNLAQVIQFSGRVFTTRCPSTVHYTDMSANGCIFHRGSVIEPAVYVDDRRAFAGMSELAMYIPAEMHHVEIYGRGGMIRAYTTGYVESIARGKRNMGPFIWW